MIAITIRMLKMRFKAIVFPIAPIFSDLKPNILNRDLQGKRWPLNL